MHSLLPGSGSEGMVHGFLQVATAILHQWHLQDPTCRGLHMHRPEPLLRQFHPSCNSRSFHWLPNLWSSRCWGKITLYARLFCSHTEGLGYFRREVPSEVVWFNLSVVEMPTLPDLSFWSWPRPGGFWSLLPALILASEAFPASTCASLLHFKILTPAPALFPPPRSTACLLWHACCLTSFLLVLLSPVSPSVPWTTFFSSLKSFWNYPNFQELTEENYSEKGLWSCPMWKELDMQTFRSGTSVVFITPLHPFIPSCSCVAAMPTSSYVVPKMVLACTSLKCLW